LLCRLSGLGLLRELPLLKFESNLVCAPHCHGKMITAFHSPINTVMIEHLGQLLHMDTIVKANGTFLSLLMTIFDTLGVSS
jgi:hypothetical protein